MLLLMPLLVWSVSLHALHARVVLESPTRHIRATTRDARRILGEGYRRSPTVESLVDRLQMSDVVVYVDGRPMLDGPLAARLTLVPSRGHLRYVRIDLSIQRPLDDAIALLGHELRHAVEIADAPGVADATGMERLYAQIGNEWAPHKYETGAAIDAERQVRKELTASPRAS